MTKEPWIIAAAISVGGWVFVGLVWLLPKKLALLRRFGYRVTAVKLTELAKQGDPDARLLRTRSDWYLILGLLIVFILALLKLLGV